MFLVSALAGAACSGKSVRQVNGKGSSFDDDDPPPGGVSSGGSEPSGGFAGTATGGIVSRGGALGRGGAGSGGSSGRASGGTSGAATGGTAGVECGPDDFEDGWGPNECWDGRACRKELENAPCPGTYREALARSLVEGVDCAGPTTEGFVYVHETYARLICAYDEDGQLSAFEFMDDNDAHCGGRAETIVGGEALPEPFTLTEFDRYRGCSISEPSFSAKSPSAIFNEDFPSLITAGRRCLPATDQCRSRILMLVCREGEEETGCGVCGADADCRAEYPYLEPDVVYCDEGACRLDERPLGSCSEGEAAPECRTRAATYVCDFGTCSVCITNTECALATDGAQSSCADDGSCVDD